MVTSAAGGHSYGMDQKKKIGVEKLLLISPNFLHQMVPTHQSMWPLGHLQLKMWPAPRTVSGCDQAPASNVRAFPSDFPCTLFSICRDVTAGLCHRAAITDPLCAASAALLLWLKDREIPLSLSPVDEPLENYFFLPCT